MLRASSEHSGDSVDVTMVRKGEASTGGGVEGTLTKSYAELAQRPWGLCCDERTARRTVGVAKRYRLLIVEEKRRWDGSQQPNAYRIDWEGVAALKNGSRTGGHRVHPPGHTDHPGGHRVRHTKENILVQSFNSVTGPGADPNPTEKDFDR